MKLKLRRDFCGPGCSLGSLSIDGLFFCHTLEDVDRKLEAGGEKVYGKTAIPRGKYQVIIDYSQRFKQIMPRLLDVPRFSGIRIHPGNTNVDTDGCILVGSVRKSDSVLNSRVTYQRLMVLIEDALDRGESIEIEIE